MNLHGWVIYNGYLEGNKFLDFAETIQQAAAEQHISIDIYRNDELLSVMETDSIGLLHIKQAELPHFAVFADKDIYLARQLEWLGVRLFNSAEAIARSDDKIASYQRFAVNGLSIPKTIAAPKAFHRTTDISATDYKAAIEQLGLPMIVKEAFGSFGEQVHMVSTEAELFAKIHDMQGKPFMLQEFVASSYGKDMRLHVVGDHVAAAMKRQAFNHFRANVTAGGTMQPYHPSENEQQLAIAATKAIGADFAGVDLLFGEQDRPIICEVNSNAHIRSMYDCTGINIADFMIDDIRKKMK
ncbi:RimK family alpha-L-glutamate ligase [Lentibacillus halophilus]|uniref:RimK family alpha-L-glutamate ligase n=1 Tax=Lentibacillus halophilus TaxID=295065 RepID=A0ABN0ZBU8_9BACI